MNGFAGLARALAGALAGCCLLAVPAGATEFCVQPADGCAGGQKPTIQQALNAALAAAGHDTVRLPAGTVLGPGSYDSANPDNTVSVVGAGRDATFVTSVTSTALDYSLDLQNGATLSDLTLKQFSPAVPDQGQLWLEGTAERIGLSSTVSNAASTISGTIRHLSAAGPDVLRINGTLEDSEIKGGQLYTGTSDTVIRRTRVVSPYGTAGQNHSLVVSSSLFVLTAATANPILATEPNAAVNAHGTTVLSNVTVIGSGDPGCIGHRRGRDQRDQHGARRLRGRERHDRQHDRAQLQDHTHTRLRRRQPHGEHQRLQLRHRPVALRGHADRGRDAHRRPG